MKVSDKVSGRVSGRTDGILFFGFRSGDPRMVSYIAEVGYYFCRLLRQQFNELFVGVAVPHLLHMRGENSDECGSIGGLVQCVKDNRAVFAHEPGTVLTPIPGVLQRGAQ